jgi:hypothetical protein
VGGGGGGGGGGWNRMVPGFIRRWLEGGNRSGGVEPVPVAAPDLPHNMRSIESKMISLWDGHGFYTGLVLFGKANKLPETEELKTRLLENQNHIAYLFMPKFNKDVAKSVAEKLQEHIAIADKLLDALIAENAGTSSSGDKLSDTLMTDWKRNADDIGSTLYKLQSRFGPYILSETKWKDEMQEHLKHLTTVITKYLGGNRAAALADINPYIEHIRHFAMTLAKLVSGPSFVAFGPAGPMFAPPYPSPYPYPYAAVPYRPLESEIVAPYSPFYPKDPSRLSQPPYHFRTRTVYYP